MLWGVHAHKTQFTGLTQGVLGEVAVGIPFSGIRRELILSEGSRSSDKALLFFVKREVHLAS
jgi:hypothetical protein